MYNNENDNNDNDNDFNNKRAHKFFYVWHMQITYMLNCPSNSIYLYAFFFYFLHNSLTYVPTYIQMYNKFKGFLDISP